MALLLLAPSPAGAQGGGAPPSHSNSPSPSATPAPAASTAAFDEALQRDLLAFFRASGSPHASAVDVGFLRAAPTRMGVPAPKFYLWVKVLAGPSVLQVGAARVAAVQERGQLRSVDVTHFFTAASIRANPDQVGRVFPAALVPAIRRKAAAP